MVDAAIFQRRFQELSRNIEGFIRGKSDVIRLALEHYSEVPNWVVCR